ncbi:MAG: thioredoxin family protein [Phycisphaeraceae bacterium]
MDAQLLKQKHDAGLDWHDYLATGTADQQAAWRKVYDQVKLTDAQRAMLGSSVREMNVVALSGIWCGDCVRQGPMFQKIAEASNGKINLKWCDRDEHMDLQERVKVCGGKRVPVVIFAAEDYEPVGWYGDKPLSRYRIQAAQLQGAGCPLPGAAVPDDELAAELGDWCDQFERVQLLLRLSGRLRQKHND